MMKFTQPDVNSKLFDLQKSFGFSSQMEMIDKHFDGDVGKMVKAVFPNLEQAKPQSLSKPRSVRQFSFARHWRNKIAPLLGNPTVNKMLTLGLMQVDPNYKPGDPPWLVGRGPLNGQRARDGCLSWYQPLGCCHHIAPFSWALANLLYPDLSWGFATGELHTVVIGYDKLPETPKMVFDILLFKQMTAKQSLNFVFERNGMFCLTPRSYFASFCDDREQVYEQCDFIDSW